MHVSPRKSGESWSQPANERGGIARLEGMLGGGARGPRSLHRQIVMAGPRKSRRLRQIDYLRGQRFRKSELDQPRELLQAEDDDRRLSADVDPAIDDNRRDEFVA